MTNFYAQPYDISANGFYFASGEEFRDVSARVLKDYGQPVEEFEIQFIDGDAIDAALFEALKVHQGNIACFLERIKDWDEAQKRALIIAADECGYTFDLKCGDPDDFEVDIYELASMKELAGQFVDEGLYGDIPEHLANYIDYDAIARDLACDYSETVIAGTALIYRRG